MNPKISGVIFGLAAFGSWGLLPAYWKQMQGVLPFEILCHRVVWSCLFLAVLISIQKRWAEVKSLVNDRPTIIRLVFSSLLIGGNWFVYIWAVNSNHVVETSLGYYINPMINVLIGYLLLGERFSRIQGIAVFCALAGVLYSLAAYGSLPMFALTLAVTFAFYGYSRKKIVAAPIPGLLVETCVLFIPAMAFILYRIWSGESEFLRDPLLTCWMTGAGVVTSLPLLWFASAAKKLNLSTIGILQYLAPSLAFLLGIFIYKEPFTSHTLVTFCFIWAGVAIYTWESISKHSGGGR